MRRQTGPDSVAGPAHVLFDGRLLDASETSGRKAYNKFDEHTLIQLKAFKPIAARSLAKAMGEKPPLTPPRVSGVSCAPLPDVEVCELAKLQQKSSVFPPNNRQNQVQRQDAGQKPVVGGPMPGFTDARPGGLDVAPLALIAEGKSFHRTSTACNFDRRLALYNEINETDSLCGTPAPFNFREMTDSLENSGPLGPLCSAPLSPSILTLCEDLSLEHMPIVMSAGGEAHDSSTWNFAPCLGADMVGVPAIASPGRGSEPPTAASA